jgi:hypothetical protein
MKVKVAEVETESEFGKGCTYCIGLFLMHAERKLGLEKAGLAEREVSLWFNGASDHLYGLEIPDKFPKALKARISRFQKKVLIWGHGWGHGVVTPKNNDKNWALQEAKIILMEIDKFLGVDVLQGGFE